MKKRAPKKREKRAVPSVRITLACAFLATFLLGHLSGRVMESLFLSSHIPVTLMPDMGKTVSVVHIDGVENGSLVGSMSGTVRFLVGSTSIVPNADGWFRVSASSVLKNRVYIEVPAGAHFVASKKGKKYYPVDSQAGLQLAPQYRVYFPDAASAESAGYVP